MFRAADIVFEARDCGELFLRRAEKYRVLSGKPEFVLEVTDDEVRSSREGSAMSDDSIRYMLSGSKFYFELIKRGGMMLHSSAVVKDGRAYLFSGPSGVGKSTHTGYWLKLYPDAYILNDDKPALRLTENGFFAYGTPWSGKHDISRNEGVPLGGIAFLERAEADRIELLGSGSAAKGLIEGTVRHIRRERMEELLATVDLIVRSTPIYRIGCTRSPSAAELAYSVMSAQAQISKN